MPGSGLELLNVNEALYMSWGGTPDGINDDRMERDEPVRHLRGEIIEVPDALSIQKD